MKINSTDVVLKRKSETHKLTRENWVKKTADDGQVYDHFQQLYVSQQWQMEWADYARHRQQTSGWNYYLPSGSLQQGKLIGFPLEGGQDELIHPREPVPSLTLYQVSSIFSFLLSIPKGVWIFNPICKSSMACGKKENSQEQMKRASFAKRVSFLVCHFEIQANCWSCDSLW